MKKLFPLFIGLLLGFSVQLLGAARGEVIKIGPQHPKWGATLTLPKAGLAILKLEARLVEGGWAESGKESGVLSLWVGKNFHSHVVVVQSSLMGYNIILGERPKGKTAVTVRWEEGLSRAKAGVEIGKVSLDLPTTEKEKSVFAGSPFLTLSASRLWNDFPMALAYTQDSPPSYQVYFTNEDGGTGRFPALLMGKYQRLADIEQALYSRNGVWHYQGPGHRDIPFEKPKKWGRPALSICTDNGMFCPDSGMHPIVLAYQPLPMPAGETRERLMDLNPWMTRLMNEEVARERDSFGKPKITQDKVVKDASAADARQYLYLDFKCQTEGTEKSIAFVVSVKGNPKKFKSDNITGIVANPADLRKTCDGSLQRTVVKLPFGTAASQVAEITPLVKGGSSFGGQFVRGFLLSDTYSPQYLLDIAGHSIFTPAWTNSGP